MVLVPFSSAWRLRRKRKRLTHGGGEATVLAFRVALPASARWICGEAAKVLSSLQKCGATLDLSGCGCDDELVAVLVFVLRESPGIDKLDLSRNPKLTAAAVHCVLALAQDQVAKVLGDGLNQRLLVCKVTRRLHFGADGEAYRGAAYGTALRRAKFGAFAES
ncbi:hypothetical protein M885DRAFT_564348 [Pelagophyceae sp. CCMP2097]|nr:hypothetical protein M885DRAFT_564348 [Pelagophyceae sp. CCMP2097]